MPSSSSTDIKMFPSVLFVSPPPALSKLPSRRCNVCNVRMSIAEDVSFDYPHRVSRSVVWLRVGDLRVDDHPGLDAACAHTDDVVAPLLVCTPKTTKQDLDAARRLQTELNALGSHLFLRYADDEARGVVAFLKQFQAERVHVRMDVEHEARTVINEVEREMDGVTSVQTWSMELHEWDVEISNLPDIPDTYPKFLQWKDRRNAIITSSSIEFQPDVIVPGPGDSDNNFPIESVAKQVENSNTITRQRDRFEQRLAEGEKTLTVVESDCSAKKYGETILSEFLRQSDDYLEPDMARSLAELFRQGALSPRRIYEIVNKHERENGRIWRRFYREGAQFVLDFLEAREFSTLLARRDIVHKVTVDGEHQAKFWRWKGYLCRYLEEGKQVNQDDKKPPLLLIHGFGASVQHFRRSIGQLKKKYHVFALDMIGYGRSEKPPMQYTQDLWECMIWDFVREVIREPVFIAGNSIGGYLGCAFAVDAYKDLSLGICLINSAGKLEDKPLQASAPKRSLFSYVMGNSWQFRRFVGNILLLSLRGRIKKTIKSVYPVNPDAADEELAREILRNSLDYGAVQVLASGFILPPPRSLTSLLGCYDGPLMVFQGQQDPLNDARGRAKKIAAQYADARMVVVDAGHCAHEEVADRFVEEISAWMESVRVSGEVEARMTGTASSAVGSVGGLRVEDGEIVQHARD